ncbi:MAG: hypothetical protein NTY80_04730 [candidate division SR1 bacterium]|nr:hypothetical protein [candidate division SR1 bacterium]
MAIEIIEHPRFIYAINSRNNYRIIKIDTKREKTVISGIFSGEDCKNHLPKEDAHPDAHAFEIQRIRYFPGTKEINPEQKLTKKASY